MKFSKARRIVHSLRNYLNPLRVWVTNKYTLFLLIILFTFVIRWQHLNRPIADRHAFRQTITYSIIQNYLKDDSNFFNSKTYFSLPDANVERLFLGELPLYQYFLSLIFKVTGENIPIGRLYSISITAITATGIFVLGKILYNKTVGFIAAILFNLFPSSIFWGSAFSPEVLAMALSTWGVTFFLIYKNTSLLISALLLGLALAIKPYFIALLPGLWYWKSKFGKVIPQKQLLLFCTILITPLIIWGVRRGLVPPELRQPPSLPGNISQYLFYNQSPFAYLTETKWAEVFLKDRVMGELLTPLGGLLLLIFPFIENWQNHKHKVILVWLVSLIITFLLFSGANFDHEYYQLILLPIASLCIARVINTFLSFLKNLPLSHLVTWTSIVMSTVLTVRLPMQSALDNYFYQEVKYDLFSDDINQLKILVPKNSTFLYIDYVSNAYDPVLINHLGIKGWFGLVDDICSQENVNDVIEFFNQYPIQYVLYPSETYRVNGKDCNRTTVSQYFAERYPKIYNGNFLQLFALKPVSPD